jgi:hypothetical protein
LVQELKKDATPEWQLLNGIKDFTEGQKRSMVLEVLYLNLWKMCLATDLDKDTSDEDRGFNDYSPCKRFRVSHYFCRYGGVYSVPQRYEYEWRRSGRKNVVWFMLL